MNNPQELGRRWAREDKPVAELITALPADQLSDQLAVALTAYATELKALYAAEAQRDALTQLGNRAAFDHHLAHEAARALRYGRVLTVALIDLDGFKGVNDASGHAAGDAALQEFARLLVATLRQSDQAFRYGGDEFTVLLPETPAAAVAGVMSRLHEQMTLAACAYGFSWGCATLPNDTDELPHLVAVADERLYAQKRQKAHRQEQKTKESG